MIEYAHGAPSADLARLQQVHKRLLARLADYCAARGIAWFLVAGSALGAVREGDTIPWDDDLDIGLPRADFDRLCAALAREPIPGTFLQDWRTEPGYPLAFAKLRLDGSRVDDAEFDGTGFHRGIFLDIFPYDAVPANRLLARIERLALGTLNFLILPQLYDDAAKQRSGLRKAVQRLSAPLRRALPSRPFIRLREALCRSADGHESEWLDCYGMFGVLSHSRTMVRRDEMLPPRPGRLGEVEVMLPAQAEAYLARLYGDFMQPPPLGQRKPEHVLRVEFPAEDPD